MLSISGEKKSTQILREGPISETMIIFDKQGSIMGASADEKLEENVQTKLSSDAASSQSAKEHFKNEQREVSDENTFEQIDEETKETPDKSSKPLRRKNIDRSGRNSYCTYFEHI